MLCVIGRPAFVKVDQTEAGPAPGTHGGRHGPLGERIQ